ncbi:MAG TPA: hypothetical protein VF933_37455 [Streptosporangiaceae bacterium]
MRDGGYLVVLAGVAALAVGCGTQRAQAVSVAAAAASTASESARVSVTTTTRTQGMSVSFTETGLFDFAHSRGVLRMKGPAGMASEELFLPPHTYVKVPGGVHGLLPRGKSWVAIGSAASGGLGTALLGPFGGTDPGGHVIHRGRSSLAWVHAAGDRSHPHYEWAAGHHDPHFGQVPGADQRYEALLQTFRNQTGPLTGTTLAAACRHRPRR